MFEFARKPRWVNLTGGQGRLPSLHYLGIFAALLLFIVLTVIIDRVTRKAIAEAS